MYMYILEISNRTSICEERNTEKIIKKRTFATFPGETHNIVNDPKHFSSPHIHIHTHRSSYARRMLKVYFPATLYFYLYPLHVQIL